MPTGSDSKKRFSPPAAADAIIRFQPAMIVTLLRSIETNVRASIPTAAWQGSLVHLPYPGRWSNHRATFIRELPPHLRTLLS